VHETKLKTVIPLLTLLYKFYSLAIHTSKTLLIPKP
jgi:hypothetical protein